jgi:hypothetical protein
MATPGRQSAGFISKVAVLVCLVLTAGCRYQNIWSGAEFESRGQFIRLAADEPLCGCLRVTNHSDRDILLRSLLQGEELGRMTLAKGASLDVRFDWAGPEGTDIYRIEGWDRPGARVQLDSVMTIDDNGWPWRACSQATCAYGLLAMNAGEQGR